MADRIVLASASRYRRELLERLRLPFEVCAPEIDESPLAGEAPRATALRLARTKAEAVRATHPDTIVIGSDQVAAAGGQVFGKPGEHAAALRQLEQLQGTVATFHTALAVASPGAPGLQLDCVDTTVRFRRLPRAALDAYLRADRAYDCAGSAKIESLGIALVESVESEDPTALIGLPLIRLTSMLARAGIAVLPA